MKEIKLCECGCGNSVTKEGNKWINHHYKGLIHSQKTKDKISKANSLKLDEDYIKEAFTKQDKTTVEIAKELNTWDTVILRRLKKMGVDTKHKLTKKGREIISQNSRKMFFENNPTKNPEVLIKIGNKSRERWKDNSYKKRVSKNISITKKGNISSRNKKSEEHKRKIGESNKGVPRISEEHKKRLIMLSKLRVGDKSPSWLGGKSFEPYTPEFNKQFKELIRQRDGFVCLKCGMREEDSLILLKCKLNIHHIDYVKKNTLPENCCALCRRCNLEVNNNRKQWTKFFQSLLSEKYGYQYSEDGKIIILLEGGNK